MSDLRFRPMGASEEDLARFAGCFAANDDPKDLRLLRWQYLKNPVGRVYVDLAEEATPDGALAGIYATFPTRFLVGGRDAVGVQSLDTLTDRNHRGKGLFTKLAASVYQRCTDSDVALVYGFPNASSGPGFFGKLGWTRLDPVPFLVLPLSARYLLRRARVPEAVLRVVPDRLPLPAAPRLAANEEVATVLALDEGYDAVWEAFSAPIRTGVVRDRAYLRWRLARPGTSYRTLVFRRAGEVRGVVAFCVLEKHGGRIGYVMELIHVPDDHVAGAALLAAAAREMSAAGADAALAWCLEHSPNRTSYRAAGFRFLPERLRPIQLHFGARALAAPADAAVANRQGWYLSYLDSDTV